MQGGEQEQDKDASAPLGFSEPLDEMLLQHGEFPATPLFPSSLRCVLEGH